MALLFTSPIVSTLHLIPYAEGLGFSRQQAAFVFTVLAAFSLLGKIGFGLIADRLDPRHVVWGMVALLCAGWGTLAAGPSYAGLLWVGACFGLGIGAAGPLHAIVIGSCFGRAGFGQVMGLGTLVGLPLISGSNPLAGWLFVSTGSYRLVFSLEIGFLLLAGALFVFLRVPAQALRASEPIDANPKEPSLA